MTKYKFWYWYYTIKSLLTKYMLFSLVCSDIIGILRFLDIPNFWISFIFISLMIISVILGAIDGWKLGKNYDEYKQVLTFNHID